MNQALHQRHGLQCSTIDRCTCYQNAMAERVKAILKGELLLQRLLGLEQVQRLVRESGQIYNTERPHLSSKMQTPDAVHRGSPGGICRLSPPAALN